MTTPLLALESVSTRYGAVEALREVSVHVNRGEIVALIGANGAGKSTLLMTICGDPQASSGRVLLDGEDITRQPTHLIMRRGVAQSPEGRRIFPRMTVRENLIMGAEVVGHDPAEGLERVFALFPRLKEREAQRGGTLSGGEQQMLAIGRALMSRPRLLLLDEPSLGLAPLLVARVYERLAAIQREQKLTALLVEQSFHAAARLASRAWVMRHGHLVGVLDAQALRSREGRQQAIDAYLGARQETPATA